MAIIVQCRLNVISFKSMSLGSSADEMYSSIHQDGHSSMPNMSENSPSFVQQQQVDHQTQPNDDQVSSMKLYTVQGLLYHRTCKPDFLCSWPSLNSYLK